MSQAHYWPQPMHLLSGVKVTFTKYYNVFYISVLINGWTVLTNDQIRQNHANHLLDVHINFKTLTTLVNFVQKLKLSLNQNTNVIDPVIIILWFNLACLTKWHQSIYLMVFCKHDYAFQTLLLHDVK